MSSLAFISLCSLKAPSPVNYQVQEKPDDVNKMPISGRGLKAEMMRGPKLAAYVSS